MRRFCDWSSSRASDNTSPPLQNSPVLAPIAELTSKTITRHEVGDVFSIGEARYIAPRPAQTFTLSHPALNRARDFGLASVLLLPSGPNPTVITAAWVQDVVEDYRRDDVFQTCFLETIVFSGTEACDFDTTKEADEYLAKLGNRYIAVVDEKDLLPGPYALIGNEMRDVWKIIDDSFGTCMATLKPQSSPSEPFQSFQCTCPDSQFPSFALRSRIKARAASNSRISGFRIIIKDNIHLKGTRVSQGNKAFHDTFPSQPMSAPCIQQLVDKGVSIVGKSKMNSFGNWEEPLEYIDFPAPFNPRGDGYQSPGGSSSGSAAAVAAYDWLDIAIGTDTWGSVTRPSQWCGVFGLRPTKGSVPIQGVEPFSQTWDTPGILGRDLAKLKDFAVEWLDPNVLCPSERPFTEIIWSTDFWDIVDHDQVDLALKFTAKIEACLGISSHKVSFQQAWAQNPPLDAAGQSLSEYIDDAANAQCYDAYHNCHDFRVKYRAQFGKEPYVSPGTSGMWSFAKGITKEKRDQGFERLAVYKRWFDDVVVAGGWPLVIMPLESMGPRYRDEAPSFKRPPQSGVNALALAAVLGSPALAVPVAEMPYHSRVTGMEEKLPFVVAVMGMPGTDLALMDKMHETLVLGGMATRVRAGRRMFLDGEGLGA